MVRYDAASASRADHAQQKLRSTKNRRKRAKTTTAQSKKKPPQKPFPFLSLPPELRDYIYELALTNEGGLTIVSTTKALRRVVRRGEIVNNHDYYRRGLTQAGSDDLPSQSNSLSPNILAVSKQLHSEGVAWLYQQRLILQDTMTLHTFLAAIGPFNRKVVTDIVVEGWGQGRGTHKAMNVAGLASLADCTNLKSFRLDCWIPWRRQMRDLARQLYRDGHHFFEQFGAANGRKDAVLDVLQLSDNNYDGTAGWYWQSGTPTSSVEENKEAFRVELRRLLGC